MSPIDQAQATQRALDAALFEPIPCGEAVEYSGAFAEFVLRTQFGDGFADTAPGGDLT